VDDRMISIWIETKDKQNLIKKLKGKEYDEGMLLIEPKCEIEELYIDSDGSITGFISTEDSLGFGINIAFKDWFKELIKFKSLDVLFTYLTQHSDEILQAKVSIDRLRDKINIK